MNTLVYFLLVEAFETFAYRAKKAGFYVDEIERMRKSLYDMYPLKKG